MASALLDGLPTEAPAAPRKKLQYADVAVTATAKDFAGIYRGKQYHEPDFDAVLERAAAVGVNRVLLTGMYLSDVNINLEVARRRKEQCRITIGVHPYHAVEADEGGDQYYHDLAQLVNNTLEEEPELLGAYGELGLDYDHLAAASKEAQIRVFKQQLDMIVSNDWNLPLFLHCRAAFDDFIATLVPYLHQLPLKSGLVHSFVGTIAQMQVLIDLGLEVSVNGFSFRDRESLDMVRAVPLEKLQIETDAPWGDIQVTSEVAKAYMKNVTKLPYVAKKKDKFVMGEMVKERNESYSNADVNNASFASADMEDTTMLDESKGLFGELSFTIIPNGLSEDRLDQLQNDIAAANGTILPFDASKGRIERLEEISYIISTTSDFPDYYRALDLMIHVVKPTWVDQSLKGNKMKNPRSYSPDPALFMSDVIICCGNLPSGDKEAIQGGVLAMGGQFTEQLSKTVTHLISLDLDDNKCQVAISKRLNLAIVLPHWFDDCLKVGRRISERPYTLPDPDILNVELSTVPTARTSQQIRDATTPDPANEPVPQTLSARSEAPRAIQAFSGKKVKLGEDLNLNSRLRGIISGMIKNGGGDITTKVQQADIYVCSYREGEDYVRASQDGKDVGNLSWLYYLITHNVWTNPMRRLMHYPRPREGVPGFEGFKISISSYTGEARVYLENLVRACGAEFTKTFKQDNTHLVAAHKNSEKCEAALEWSVNIVNHLWLEDCYAKCKLMPISDNRYTYFPSRTNLGEVLGQTEIDRDATEKLFFSTSRKPIKPAKAPAAPPGPPADSLAHNLSMSRTASDSVARSSPAAERVRRTKTTEADATPLPVRHADGKENNTPGSRGAKDRALSKLHNAADDIAAFEKEMKRKGGVIHGGKRRAEDEVEDRAKKAKGGRDSVSSKRSADELDQGDRSDEEEIEAPTRNKKAKKDKLEPIKYRMLISKDERWAGNMEKESKDKARLRELGLFITEDFKKVDILCAPQAVRTKKFVAAMACGPALVGSSYLDFALRNNKLPPPEKHAMDVRDFEKEHGFKMAEAVERALQNRHRLFRDWTIFCTDKVPGGYETYKDIIEANGGKCSLWKGRTTNITATRRIINASAGEESQNQKEDEGDVLYLISDANSNEFTNWTKFRDLAKKHNMVPRIVKTEWLLINAMAQYVHWKPEWELTEEVVKAAKP
ncbi:hypothetical protein E8E13_004120 [Curvularia kusanoi]|uniref:BRCT domain-containing protein n=1 Tax=Curvularia kusanoi TaxID=90978 RepID=A0A9P4TBL3_CURKU|nr:hypothetical protein E8E13_004120 [Curvularia kusanoi]